MLNIFWVRNWSHIAAYLVDLVLVGWALHSIKTWGCIISNQMGLKCSSYKHALIAVVRFSMWRHIFEMSFYTEVLPSGVFFSKWPLAAILNLIQPEMAPFDPPSAPYSKSNRPMSFRLTSISMTLNDFEGTSLVCILGHTIFYHEVVCF